MNWQRLKRQTGIYTDGAFTVVKDLTLANAQLKAASVTVSGNVTMTNSQVEADGAFTFNKDLTIQELRMH